MSITRKQVFAKAAETGVEIDEERDWSHCHFHAYAPQGKIFAGSTCHNTGLGDAFPGEPPDWKFMFNEIELMDCDQGPECDYCHPE